MWPKAYLLYAAAGAAAFGFTGGWVVRDWRCDAVQLAAVKKAAVVKDKATAAVSAEATDYEEVRGTITQTATIERNTVREIYRDVEVPADCAVVPAGRVLLENARERANAAARGELGAGLPAAAPDPDPAGRSRPAAVGTGRA